MEHVPVDESLVERIANALLKRQWTLSTAESCTGGGIGHYLTSLPGSSEFYVGGVIAYSNEVKATLLGVDRQLLSKYGAVSNPCAAAMAEGCRRLFNTDVAVAVTGIAGPGGGSAEKPVGLVFIGIATRSCLEVAESRFSGTREEIRRSAVQRALEMVLESVSE
jgi:PncC family amidohydrolase